MLAIFTALASEARACIDYFELVRDQQQTAFPLYRKADLVLAVTGVGKLRAAAVSACALTSVRDEIRFVLNLGCCGAAQHFALGQACLVQRIIDHASGSEFFPDLLLKHRFAEAPLVTVDRALCTGTALPEHPDALYDMEASGVFTSARMFLPSSAVQAIKVVSDHLAPTRADFTNERIYQLFRPLMPQLDSYLQAARIVGNERAAQEPTALDTQQLERLTALLGLSFSQRQLLAKRAALLPRESADLLIASALRELQIAAGSARQYSKQERNACLHKLLASMSSSIGAGEIVEEQN